MAPTVDGLAAVATRSSEVTPRDTDPALESMVEKLVVPEEQTTFPKVLKGVVRHDIWPPSPLVVPPATEEEDEMEEIEREESRPQAV